MSHIEYKDCQFLKLGYVKELRAQDPRNSGKFEAIRAAFAWGSTEVASVQRQLNDCPAVKDAQASADISAGPSSLPRKQDTSDDQFVQAFVRNKVGKKLSFNHINRSNGANVAEEEDLISFDAPALVLNASWDQPTVLNSAVDFHASVPVENKTSPAKVQNKSNDSSTNVRTPFNNLKTRIPATPVAAPITTVPAWDTSYAGTPTSATLFPNARPAIVPPTALMESLSVTAPSAQPIYDEHDPNDPNFNASRYYNNFARSYKCPHRGCKKNMPSASAFIQHLRSPLHMKVYNSLTSFEQLLTLYSLIRSNALNVFVPFRPLQLLRSTSNPRPSVVVPVSLSMPVLSLRISLRSQRRTAFMMMRLSNTSIFLIDLPIPVLRSQLSLRQVAVQLTLRSTLRRITGGCTLTVTGRFSIVHSNERFNSRVQNSGYFDSHWLRSAGRCDWVSDCRNVRVRLNFS